jgi:hypothetical protein
MLWTQVCDRVTGLARGKDRVTQKLKKKTKQNKTSSQPSSRTRTNWCFLSFRATNQSI